MPHLPALLGFALVSFGMVLTPGPNMIYLISRSIAQGSVAGMVSLGGMALGFVFYMLCTAFGITALLFAVPYAYDALRVGGALYLLWLAWQVLKPNGLSPFQVRELPVDSPRKLFMMGFVTNLLNPKIAMLYLALLPQFIDPARGSVLLQSLVFGTIQDRHQRQRPCADRVDRRLDHGISRRAPGMAQGPALDDGHRACRFRAAHGL
jgi:threonine/homoserine/homoserine lactone efflux protein